MKKEARFMNICQEMDSKVRGRSSFDLILNEKFQVGYQVMEMDNDTEATKTKLNLIQEASSRPSWRLSQIHLNFRYTFYYPFSPF